MTFHSSSDRSLLETYHREQSEDAFKELVRRHAGMVHEVAKRVLGNDIGAEDVAQAVFMLLLRQGPHLKNVAGWLYRTAYFAARDANRLMKRRVRHEKEAGTMGFVPEQSDRSDGVELRKRLDAALATLPARQRDTIVLRYFEGMPIARIAQAMECPEKTVHSRTTAAIKRLRSRFNRKSKAFSALALTQMLNGMRAAPASPSLLSSIHSACLDKAGVNPNALILKEAMMKKAYWMKMKLIGCTALAGSLFLVAAYHVGGLGQEQPVATNSLGSRPNPKSREVRDRRPKGSKPDAPLLDCHDDPLPAGAIARLGTTRFRHAMRLVRFDEEGNNLIGWGTLEDSGANGFLRTWNLSTGRSRVDRIPTSIKITEDGRKFATVDQDEGSNCNWPYGSNVNSNSDSRRLRKPSAITIFERHTGKRLLNIREIDTRTFCFSLDGQKAAAWGLNGMIQVRDLNNTQTMRTLKPEPHTPGFHSDNPSWTPHLSKDGSRLVAVPQWGEVCFWDLANPEGKLQMTKGFKDYAAFQAASSQVAVSPNGFLLATRDRKGAYVIWDLRDNSAQEFVTPNAWPFTEQLKFSSDGNALLAIEKKDSSAKRRISLLDGRNGKTLFEQDTPYYLKSAIVSDNGSLVSWCDAAGILRVHHRVTGQAFRSPYAHQAGVSAVAFSGDGSSVITVAENMRFWNPRTGKPNLNTATWISGGPRSVQTAVCSPDGSYIAASNGEAIRFISLEHGEHLFTLKSDEARVPARPAQRPAYMRKWLFLHPNQKLLLALSEEGEVETWNLDNKRITNYFEIMPHAPGPVTAMPDELNWLLKKVPFVAAASFSPDGDKLAIQKGFYGFDGQLPDIEIWDLESAKMERTIKAPEGIWGLRFTPDGKQLAYLRLDLAVSRVTCDFIEAHTGKLKKSIPLGKRKHSFSASNDLAFSSDGRLLAVTLENGSISLHSVSDGKRLSELKGHRAPVTCLAFSPDGSLLVSGSNDTTALVWDINAILKKGSPGDEF